MFKKTRIQLGEGHINKYTIFENKSLFSIYFHVFNTIAQDRFHTHAFDGWAFVIRGGYEEEFKDKNGVHKKWIGIGIRFIKKCYNHRLLRSKPNTMSILITGPWAKFWTEEKDGRVRTLTWGRKEIKNNI